MQHGLHLWRITLYGYGSRRPVRRTAPHGRGTGTGVPAVYWRAYVRKHAAGRYAHPPPYLRRGRGTLWLHAPVNTGPHDGAHVRREERLHLVCRQRVVHLDGRDADLLRVRATARF